jgi:hypothetical protein
VAGRRTKWAAQRGRQYLLLLRLADRLDVYGVPAATLVVTLAVATVLVGVGAASPSILAGSVGTAVVGAVVAYFASRLVRTNRVFSQIALSYIATGDRDLLDELLGRLITGRFSTRDFKPADQLFQTLNAVADEDDFEARRRLAEAIPGLVELDRGKTIMLMRRLRGDWDQRWRGDVRRRAVEALIIPSKISGRRILDLVDRASLDDLLLLRDDDEVWTACAVVEVAQVSAGELRRKADFEREDEVTRGLDAGIARLRISGEERAALEHYRLAIATLIDRGPESCLAELDQLVGAVSIPARASAARMVSLVLTHPGAKGINAALLGLVKRLSEDPERYVRRPLARELCVEFLLDQLDGPNAEEARGVLFEHLLTDEDWIIPLTTFDLLAAGRIKNDDLREAAEAVSAAHGGDSRVGRRAARALSAIGDAQ